MWVESEIENCERLFPLPSSHHHLFTLQSSPSPAATQVADEVSSSVLSRMACPLRRDVFFLQLHDVDGESNLDSGLFQRIRLSPSRHQSQPTDLAAGHPNLSVTNLAPSPQRLGNAVNLPFPTITWEGKEQNPRNWVLHREIGTWRKMTTTRRFFALLILIAVSLPSPVCATKDDFVFCENVIHKWSKSSSDDNQIHDKSTLKDLLFFLHVPRTGGRTYFHCFLRKLYKGEQECPRSYDKLRFDPSKEKCHLMVTHDDYSFMSKLSKERTSVVTILRNPIDRVFSTYEFSLEVAARFLVHPNLTSATQMSIRLRPKSRDVSTLDIWPWKYLVPWMRKDLFERRDARKFKKAAVVYATGDPYSMKEMVMPLLDFINDPISHDIVHNGATFQVAGLTNNSGFAEAHEVRHCVRKHPSLGHYILKVAKKRLDNMLYVGLTEEHKKSAIMFANMVGAQVLSQNASSSYFLQNAANSSEDSRSASSDETESSTVTVSESKVPSEDFKENENMTVGKLMKAYETCTSGLRKTQVTRRTMSLKQVAPANFSKKARKLVPQNVLQQILMLNNLDVELYKHAQGIFERQHKHLEQSTGDEQIHNISDSAMKRNKSGCFLGYSQWDVFLIAAASFLLIFLIYLFLTRSRQASKLKI